MATITVATLTSASLSPDAYAQIVNIRDVIVNEIHYDPDDQGLEFVELYNRSSAPVSLAEFEIADSRMVPVELGVTDLLIDPDEYVILARNRDALTTSWPDASMAAAVVTPAPWPALNNTGDAVVLTFRGVAIDSVSFSPSWGGEGVSLERIDPNGPSSVPSNWASSTSSSGATPGMVNSIFLPDREPPRVVFAEHSTEPTDFTRPATVTVTFSEPIVLPSLDSAPFMVDGLVPDRIVLSEPHRTSATLHGVPEDARFVQINGVSDFVGNLLASTARIARVSHPGEIVINEIMYDPRSDGDDGLADQVEYVELANTTPDFLTLRGLRLTRAPNETQVVDTLVRLDRRLGIEPDGFAVMFADQSITPVEDLYTSSLIVFAHPRDYATLGAVLIPVSSQSIGLTNAGGDLYLRSRAGATLDSLRYDPSWHNPNVRTTTGVALERIDPLGPSSTGRNWTSSSYSDGGTPGSRNSVHLTPGPVEKPGTLRVEPSPFSPDGDGLDDVTGIAFALDADASLVRIRVYDSRGRHVRTVAESMLSGRTGSATWDGLSDGGHELQIGIYVVLLESTDTANGRAERLMASVVLARALD